MPKRSMILAVVALLLALAPARAADPITVRVNVFSGVQNLAIFAGQAKGLFARHGLTVELQTTPNSPAQRAGLAEGKFEIAHAGVDNAVAMVELAKVDAVIVMGGDNSLQELFVQPGIASIADLKGKTVIVDAPNTAYALVVKKALMNQGLAAGRDYTLKPTGGTFQRLGLMRENKEHAATMLNPPFSVMAARDGFKSLGLATKLVGSYQGTGAFVLRSWAKASGETLERYIGAYVEATRWSMAPANRAEAAALLADRLKLAPDVAAATLEQAVRDGFAPDARLDMDGFRGTLAVRAATENTWNGPAPAPDKYVDLSYYQRAIAALGR
ncbi:MAG: ABC transporter substrate-binding protein [Candidatus Rokubacteria bacterium]|nr:ABC transporter substrate-binding protein [Candidatus Rokubacteria bacterium]